MQGWPIGEQSDDGRWIAPSAERNKDPILAVLRRVLPASGLVLEIGSGTGQHVAHFAKAMSGLTWQPSDADIAYRQSVQRWIELDHLANVRAPISLDVHDAPWPIGDVAAVIAINVLHVSPWSATAALFDGARDAVRDDGIVLLYGPFMRGGRHTAESNARFDASLRERDPQWGVRDLDDVVGVAQHAGFAMREIVEMPANNLCVVFANAAAMQ
jgi:SAM-dependent methyltransferase